MEGLQIALKAYKEQLTKKSNSFYDAVQQATSQKLREQALQNALSMGLVGTGAGMAGRGFFGLLELIRRNASKPPRSVPTPVPIDLPLEENESKIAGVADFLRGDYAQSISGVPWAVPAAVGAGGAGLVGGWSLMDYLLDKRRKGDLDAELEKAKSEYESALIRNTAKTANDDSLGADLDRLYDLVEKKADYWSDLAGKLTGLYGIYAGTSGLAGAALAYNWGKKRQRKAIIEKALKERRRRRFSSQPAPVYLRPHQIGTSSLEDPEHIEDFDKGLEL